MFGALCLLMSITCSVVAPAAATDAELRLFHSAEYLDCLRRLPQLADCEYSADDWEQFGLGKKINSLVSLRGLVFRMLDLRLLVIGSIPSRGTAQSFLR